MWAGVGSAGETERLSHLDRCLLSTYDVLGTVVGPGTSLMSPARGNKKISCDCGGMKSKAVVAVQGY